MQTREPFNRRINVLRKKQRIILQYIFLLITELYCITYVKSCDDLRMLNQRKKTWETKKDKRRNIYVFHLEGVQGILRYYILWYSGRLFKYLASSVFAGRRYPPAIIISWIYEVMERLTLWISSHQRITIPKEHMKSRIRLWRHRFIRLILYDVRCTLIPINSSLLSITLHSSVKRLLVYKDRKYFNDVITEIDLIC
jgi:hypothetical protein